MRRLARNNGLSIVTLGMFLVIWLGGQAWAGHRSYNDEQRAHGEPAVSMTEYLTRAEFGEATFENWESEFLQMGVYVLLTAWLLQRGSAESRPLPEDTEDGGGGDGGGDGDEGVGPDAPWPVRRGGLARRLYEHSLSIALLGLFLLAFLGHLVTGSRAFSAEQVAHGEPGVSVIGYLFRSQFWFESLQNWQSEFLAVGTLVLLSVFLRQKGSPESKPVAAPHGRTGSG